MSHHSADSAPPRRIFTQIVTGAAQANEHIALPFAQRQKARQRLTLESGESVGLKLPRGIVLRDGVILSDAKGTLLRIDAAPEPLSCIDCQDPERLARAAYHLGNRHQWVQVGPGYLRYLHDHVLDAMITGLGLTVTVEELPFEPEAGAYGSHGHHHHD